MRRVRSVVLALMLAALLAACAPAAPVPTAVPTLTATLAPTLTPTLTLVPTATEIPTATPTPTATPEDFSDLPYAKTFKEAAVMEGTVTREDIESGRLRAYAAILYKKNAAESSNESFSPLEVHLSTPVHENIYLKFDSTEGVDIVVVFPYIDEHGSKSCIALQSIPTTEGINFLTYAFPVDSSKIGQMLLGWLNDQEVITPYYDSPTSRGLSKLIEEVTAKGANSRFEVDQIWVRDLPKVQALMRQWEETGVFPEELSDYVLEPLPID